MSERSEDSPHSGTQEQSARLDSGQYSCAAIENYESVFGRDFVSPGGARMADAMIARLALAPGQRILDVGSGLGGTAFAMARAAEVTVEGIDLSRNMLDEARRRASVYRLDTRVRFDYGDGVLLDRPGRYQRIISRDVFLHIADKPRLFKALCNALEHGGLLLFTDYCCGPRPWPAGFDDYVRQRAYTLHTLDEYHELLCDSGLVGIQVEDLSQCFAHELQRDCETIAALPDTYPAKRELVTSWTRKRAHSTSGDLKWGLFTARNPERCT